MNPIKIAILSCNHGHSRSYYSLKYDPFFDLVGVSVKPGYDNLNGLHKYPDIKRYDSDEELYDANPDLEAVIVASDNQSHFSQVCEAVKRGMHIYSMKVPTFDMDEYNEMLELCDKAGVVCQIELEMRYHAELYRVKELIGNGKIGKLLSVNLVNYSHNPGRWRPWVVNPEASYGKRIHIRDKDYRFRGGALADHPHLFDIIRFVTDSEFDSVYADVSPNIRDGIETEDMIRIIGKLKNGTNFSIDPSYANNEKNVTECKQFSDWMKYPQTVEVFATFVGTEGVIISDLYDKRYYEQSDPNGDYMCLSDVECSLPWLGLMNDFYYAVREGAERHVTLRYHKPSIAAMNAAYKSVSEQRVIKL